MQDVVVTVTSSFGYCSASGGYGANCRQQHAGGVGGNGSGGNLNVYGGGGNGHGSLQLWQPLRW